MESVLYEGIQRYTPFGAYEFSSMNDLTMHFLEVRCTLIFRQKQYNFNQMKGATDSKRRNTNRIHDNDEYSENKNDKKHSYDFENRGNEDIGFSTNNHQRNNSNTDHVNNDYGRPNKVNERLYGEQQKNYQDRQPQRQVVQSSYQGDQSGQKQVNFDRKMQGNSFEKPFEPHRELEYPPRSQTNNNPPQNNQQQTNQYQRNQPQNNQTRQHTIKENPQRTLPVNSGDPYLGEQHDSNSSERIFNFIKMMKEKYGKKASFVNMSNHFKEIFTQAQIKSILGELVVNDRIQKNRNTDEYEIV